MKPAYFLFESNTFYNVYLKSNCVKIINAYSNKQPISEIETAKQFPFLMQPRFPMTRVYLL